jgi:hypothetical protein
MWQPSRPQWSIIWAVALLAVLAWPPDQGSSLGAKLLGRLVDPFDTLPALPPPLPIGLDDDGDAVTEHDALVRSYYDVRDRSTMTRWRMAAKLVGDPLEVSTQRQLVIALVVAAGLLVWMIEGSRR